MHSLTLHARVGKDGILKIETPIGVRDTELEVLLVVHPVNESHRLSAWTSEFFSRIVGGWEGARLVREPQGAYQSRNEFK